MFHYNKIASSLSLAVLKRRKAHSFLVAEGAFQVCVELGWLFDDGMNLSFFSSKSRNLLARAFHAGKRFLNPSSGDIVFKAICVNLKRKRWSVLERLSPKLTSSLVSQVVCEFQNSPQLALDFYNWVGGLFPHSLDSCCTLVHVLVKSRRFHEALFLLRNLIAEDGTSPLVVLEVLIESYQRCCSSIAAFDSLVRACTQVGATEGAYDVIYNLRSRGCFITIHAWNNFLNHLLQLNEIDRFWNLYRGMGSFGYIENVNTFNLVIYALCKECRLVEAISVLYRMMKGGIFPNVVSFNIIIDAACRIGNLGLSLKLFKRMTMISGDFVWPNSVTYNCIINGFCKTGKLLLAEEMLHKMAKAGKKPSVRAYATLIDGYARWGSLEEALRLCDVMVERGLVLNNVVYNSILYWLYREGGIEEASLLLSDMIDKHIWPDQYSYAILTKGLCRNGNLTEALKLHSQILEHNLIHDSFSHNILLNYICKRKNMAVAKRLLGNMITRGLAFDVHTYGTMIDGYCKLDAAEYIVDELRKRRLFDATTFNTLISGYCTGGQIDKVFNLTMEMKSLGISANRVTYNTLINLLCKCGCEEEAKELMKMMIVQGICPDFVTYTTLVTHFKKCSPDEVIALHDYMILKGVVPDQKTYDIIVTPLLLEEG
ncbi:pentatricopeptide repeat-containing protein At1g11710, mitochondrial-like isoform X3 [Arachis ipaensis]|nr:pentatricopeptide repeat-containing protein At1g11710, mitochondrial-like isoform X3 [Arachis ipaensis]XP_029151436.1 pentatricopeptide repeat-containing protein At1g11710, mitochondrial isoform X3 [Arachis hypogaea]